ncbi:hypothetical protein QUB70_22200 [Microcoleus sp. A003_D6]
MPIPQEKKFCGMGILPVLVIFARGLVSWKNRVLRNIRRVQDKQKYFEK